MPTQNTTNFYFAAWCVCVCAMHQSENHWSSFFSTQIDCAHNGTSSDAFHNFYSAFMSWVKTAQVSECRSGIDTKPWANSTHCRVDWLINQTPINGSFKKCLPFHAIEKKGDLCKSFAFDFFSFIELIWQTVDESDFNGNERSSNIHDFFVENAFQFFLLSISLIYHIEMLNKCRWITRGIVLYFCLFFFSLKFVGPINHIQLEHFPHFASWNPFHFFDKLSHLEKKKCSAALVLCVQIWSFYHVCNSVCWLQIEIYTQNQQPIYLHWSKMRKKKNWKKRIW